MLASPEISADESRFSEVDGTTRKIREVDRLKEIAITKSKLSNAPSLRQPGEGVGWDDDNDGKMAFAEPLVQLMTDCKLRKSDITAAAIDRRVRDVIDATSIVTLYKAVITAAELKKYFGEHGIQFGRDELDSKSIASFLLEARAQRRAGNSLVWMSSNLQLRWPITELAETLGSNSTHSCNYNRFSWLLPPGHGKNPLLALWYAAPGAVYCGRSLW